MENSKEAADAGSFGVEAHFHGRVAKQELIAAAQATVVSTAGRNHQKTRYSAGPCEALYCRQRYP